MNERVLTERRGQLLLIGLNRPEKRNAADLQLLHELARAYAVLEADPDLRVGVLHGVGGHFTGGLDLNDIGPRLVAGDLDLIPPDGIDPWGLRTPPVSKPVVMAVAGTCLTLGIELALAADLVIAGPDARFAQLEVSRGILAFGGATLRLPRLGWGDAMRWLLTGDAFDADEALRIGLVQEIALDPLARALELAQRIADQAPLAVRATLANARLALSDPGRAAQDLPAEVSRLANSDDARRAMAAYLDRRPVTFTGQ